MNLNSEKSLPELEKEILYFWKEKKIFQKSLDKNKRKKTFVFYEGPPTANGKPGLHHVLARSYKDVVCRYKSMRGFNVPRQAGWDTHGLPVEIQVEKELGLKSKKDIENLVPGNLKASIKKFNQHCRQSVWKYQELWEDLTEKMGYWIDTQNPYVTYLPRYIESVWWILSEIYKQKLLYQGHRIVHWCSRCGTGLSSHEIAQGYQTVTETSLFIKFKLLPNQKIGNFKTDNQTYISSWTTTPWTLPGNVALAIGSKIKYQLTQTKSGEKIIHATGLPKETGIIEGKKIKEFSGQDLIGLKYQPLFKIPELQSEKSYQVYPASFVTTEDGTGIVHTAVMYGEDDYQLGKKLGLPTIHTVDQYGKFKNFVPDLSRLPVKDKATEEKIVAHLKKNHSFLSAHPYKHEYPHCWRCDTPILYYARSSWFIKMSKLKQELLKNNSQINWVPNHIKDGRFGQWLKDVKDWSLSRERYWGTPLPIWKCSACQKEKIISSIDELDKSAVSSQNSFYIIRHGEALSNSQSFNSSWPEKKKNSLTPKGQQQVTQTLKELSKLKIDIIISSDIDRAKQTAQIIKQELGIKTLVFDKRLREVDFGSLNGQSVLEYRKLFNSPQDHFTISPPKGETLKDVKARMVSAFKNINQKYQHKNILIVSHEDPLIALSGALLGLPETESYSSSKFSLKNAQVKKLNYKNIPLNDQGDLDLHRPFIDEVKLTCSCGHQMERVPELIDVWFDAGSMPYASLHYPQDNKDLIDKKKFFPAEFISEAVDQTRGWFYTLLAISTLLKKGTSYKNVICLGHINDKHGKKMSKSKGNIVDPWEVFSQYGADPVRWHLFTVNDAGETKNFDENDVKKVSRNIFNTLKNSFVYFSTYSSKQLPKKSSPHILDQWMLTRLNQVKKITTTHIEDYQIPKAARAIEELIDDISRWYIRRSRPRFQDTKNKSDWQNASATLHATLLETAQLMAPFAPFFSESLFRALKAKSQPESVHLTSWPSISNSKNQQLLKDMDLIKKWSSLGLAERSELGLKVRQPLAELKIKSSEKISANLLEILKDEVNVKKVSFVKSLPDKKEVALDSKLTPELKEEGLVREFIRFIQSLRGQAGLKPGQPVNLYIEKSSPNLGEIISTHSKEISTACSLKKIYFSKIKAPKIKKDSTLEPFGQISLSLK